MAILRTTVVRPEPEHRQRVIDLFDEMNAFFSQQTGFISALTFTSHDGDEVGRLGVWDTEDHVDAVAQMGHTLALRSRLVEVMGHNPEEERDEMLYTVISSSAPLEARQ